MSRDIIPAEVRTLIRGARDNQGLSWNAIGRATGLGMREIAASDLYWDRVDKIEPAGLRETYDLEVEGDHNFLANDMVVHNSHAASFSLLVYASAWLKRHHPAAFAAGLLNAQPMGFYQPAQIVRDAREHGVPVRPVCVQASGWDARLEPVAPGEARAGGSPALRLGMRLVKGLRERAARAIEEARREGPFRSLDDLVRRTGLSREPLERLAEADAFAALGLERREAVFEALSRRGAEPPLFAAATGPARERVALPRLSELLGVAKDYATIGLTLGRHPVAHVRPALDALGARAAADLQECDDGARVSTAGLVICRQRPQTASGIVFFTLEDETGSANLIVKPDVFERFRRVARGSQFVLAAGKVERDGTVIHVLVRKLQDLSHLFRGEEVETRSRDFH
jgi:error-prone DNA polymerase